MENLFCFIELETFQTESRCSSNGIEDRAQREARRLYGKYIREGAELQVNLSSVMRKKLDEVLDDLNGLRECSICHITDMTMEDLRKLMEGPQLEMRRFIGQSFTRFKSKPEFESVRKLLMNPGDRSQESLSIELAGIKTSSPKNESFLSLA